MNLVLRVLSALVLLPVVLSLAHLGGWYFYGFLVVSAGLCHHEYAGMVARDDSPARVFEDLAYSVTAGWSASLSDTGTLLVAGSDVNRGRLFEVSLAGGETPIAGPIREYSNPRVSPDGRLIGFAAGNGLWTLEVARGVETRIASSGSGSRARSTRAPIEPPRLRRPYHCFVN